VCRSSGGPSNACRLDPTKIKMEYRIRRGYWLRRNNIHSIRDVFGTEWAGIIRNQFRFVRINYRNVGITVSSRLRRPKRSYEDIRRDHVDRLSIRDFGSRGHDGIVAALWARRMIRLGKITDKRTIVESIPEGLSGVWSGFPVLRPDNVRSHSGTLSLARREDGELGGSALGVDY
jgi:hypothetical protein